MSTEARRRLMRDFSSLQSDPPQGVSGAPLDSNIMTWQAVIFGPEETPWEGGVFKLLLGKYDNTEKYKIDRMLLLSFLISIRLSYLISVLCSLLSILFYYIMSIVYLNMPILHHRI